MYLCSKGLGAELFDGDHLPRGGPQHVAPAPCLPNGSGDQSGEAHQVAEEPESPGEALKIHTIFMYIHRDTYYESQLCWARVT